MTTDCGTCVHCRLKFAHQLAYRCVLHASLSQQNCFLTLTYDEKLPTYHNNFQYSDIQKFKKRLTAHCKYHYDKQIKVFNVHEYGKKGKKHWHLVVFNHDFSDKLQSPSGYYNSETLLKLWPYGHHSIGDVTEASAMYQAQYMKKDIENNYVTSKKKSHSKHSGIGGPYFLKHYRQILRLGYIPINGKKMPLPRYFERLAHKHYCHFHDRSAFGPTKDRKARLYSPFETDTDANEEMSDLYISYKTLIKDPKIQKLSEDWDVVISQFLTTKTKPDFMKSAENTLYDLGKKQQQGNF